MACSWERYLVVYLSTLPVVPCHCPLYWWWGRGRPGTVTNVTQRPQPNTGSEFYESQAQVRYGQAKEMNLRLALGISPLLRWRLLRLLLLQLAWSLRKRWEGRGRKRRRDLWLNSALMQNDDDDERVEEKWEDGQRGCCGMSNRRKNLPWIIGHARRSVETRRWRMTGFHCWHGGLIVWIAPFNGVLPQYCSFWKKRWM